MERELPGKSVVTVAYVARRGLHLQREANINQPTPEVVAANPGVNLDALRPYKGYNSIRETDNVSRSMYNSLQLSWNKRYSHGFTGGASYTLSKSMDYGSAQRDIIPNTYNAANMCGQSDFDVRHIFIANYSYDLPFFRDAQQSSAARCSAAGRSAASRSSRPARPAALRSATITRRRPGRQLQLAADSCGSRAATPTIVHDIALNGASDNKYWFKTTDSSGNLLWTQPAKGTFNNLAGSRNSIHNPGFINWNMGLYKKFAITEKTGFQFRAAGVQPVQSPQLERRELQPDQPLHLRKGHRQDRRRPQHAVLAQAVLLVRAGIAKDTARPGNRAGFFSVPVQTTRGKRCLRVTHSSLRKTFGPT